MRIRTWVLELGDLGAQQSLRDLQPAAQQEAGLLHSYPGSVFQKVFMGHRLLRPQENKDHTPLCT